MTDHVQKKKKINANALGVFRFRELSAKTSKPSLHNYHSSTSFSTIIDYKVSHNDVSLTKYTFWLTIVIKDVYIL